MSQNTPIKVTRWQRWRIVFYGLLGLVVYCLLYWGYARYQEYGEWVRIDEMLAEQDKKHPHWRWLEYLPKPLQSGEVNGALRFIEVGKQITDKMIADSDYPDDDRLKFPEWTREWTVTLDRDSIRRSNQLIRERCKAFEKELPKLAIQQAGCPPFNEPRPSADVFRTGTKESQQPYLRDEASLGRSYRWLRLITLHFADEGDGDQAVLAWRAFLAQSTTDVPGLLASGTRANRYYWAFKYLYQLLGRTEPSEAAMRDLQQTIVDWRAQLFTLDDVAMDRAWSVELLRELNEKFAGLPTNAMLQVYAKPSDWLPDSWQEWAKQKGIGAPSYGHMFRLEYQTHFRMLDFFEEKLKAGKSVYREFHTLFDDENTLPGRHFLVYIAPRWKKIMADLQGLDSNLLCMEALIATERYRLKHGEYPKQWSDLVPSLLKEVPQAGDQTYKLKPVPEGLVIYVPRGKDYGGKVLRKYNPESNETDWETDQGLMIFYPKYRRQPPPPVKPKDKSEEP